MDDFFERLIASAATIDERLSDAFEPVPGRKSDTDLAARRLAAWCRNCASGDWSLFNRRLERDGLSFSEVPVRLGTIRRKPSVPVPAWIVDAIWVEAALQNPRTGIATDPLRLEPFAFEHLLAPLVEQANIFLWSKAGERSSANLSASAHADLRQLLRKQLSDVLSEALYEHFNNARNVIVVPTTGAKRPPQPSSTFHYDCFVADMMAGGFRRMFENKPVLLRLIAVITRQWIDTTCEFASRLDADLRALRREILDRDVNCRVDQIEGDLSDPHNGGHSVFVVRFEDGCRVVYKPKDLRLDVAWYALVQRLNRSECPVDLKAARAIARDGYGWTEFIDHFGCAEEDGLKRFFRRAGAWLALFHCFAGSDMHEENLIAAGEYPVPIDIEVILQAAATDHLTGGQEAEAFDAAVEFIDNSVMMIGLLPTYRLSPNNELFAMGGMVSDWNSSTDLAWRYINTDAMTPVKRTKTSTSIPNLPHVSGCYGLLGDYIDDFVSGFQNYATFLLRRSRDREQGGMFDGFAGLPIRKMLRPTGFYYLLLRRLMNHSEMDDGAVWSAQADFLARLADWERNFDPLWPLQRSERKSLMELNVPHFSSLSDGEEICAADGISVPSAATSGLNRARVRVHKFDEQDIVWQTEVILQNTALLPRSGGSIAVEAGEYQLSRNSSLVASNAETFLGEAENIAADLSRYAIRRASAAAWIGLDRLGDSEAAQLAPLGADLYNGVTGIALFLAAHGAVTGSRRSRELALAAVAQVRKNLNSRNAPRMARFLGTGGATGMGSIVYALAVIAKCLRDDDVLKDAHVAAGLFSQDLIAADKRLDVFGGNAGGILGLLRLHRDSPSLDLLERAVACGNHLLAQPLRGENGGSWLGQGSGEQALNGMSHGAAGFAYALASLAAASGRHEFANAASQCIEFENARYDTLSNNWPDLRANVRSQWSCQWCHGAAGIGIARAAIAKRGGLNFELLTADVRKAITGVERGWPSRVDTLCCGALGSIEFLCEAATALDQQELRTLAAQRMAAIIDNARVDGDYRWDVGTRRFNVGLFRGLAGVGYTLLRRVDETLPNILMWE